MVSRAPGGCLDPEAGYFRLSEIATADISVPGAWIEIDC
jgi:hypothetical protein